MKLFRNLAIGLLAAGLLTSTVAEAKKAKKGDEAAESAEEEKYEAINAETNIAEFNPTWSDAKAIQDKVTSFETDLDKVRTDLNTAAGIATDAPIQTALDDLKEKAAGKLTVALDGGKPTVTASEALPENVQAVLDAVNSGVDTVMGIVENGKTLPDDVKALIDTAKGFPAQLKPDLLSSNGLKAKDLGKETKVVKANTQATIQTQDRVKGVLEAAKNFVEAVKGLAG